MKVVFYCVKGAFAFRASSFTDVVHVAVSILPVGYGLTHHYLGCFHVDGISDRGFNLFAGRTGIEVHAFFADKDDFGRLMGRSLTPPWEDD